MVKFEKLTYIINKCLHGYSVPEQWKIAYIWSIYEKRNKQSCNSFKAISIMSTISRLYERVLRDLIEIDFGKNKEEEQICFQPGRSCTDNFLPQANYREKDRKKHGNPYYIREPSKYVQHRVNF